MKKHPGKPPFFYILIRSRKSYSNFDRCVDSVLKQTYKNYQILFSDDASGLSPAQKKHIRERLKGHISVFNKNRRYSLYNAWYLINKYAKNDTGVIFNLDGDDWLYSETSLETVSNAYLSNPQCVMTYGECFLYDKRLIAKPARTIIPYANIPYPKKVVKTGSYRKYPFLPLHARTWKVSEFKKINTKFFMDSHGNWLRFAEDQAICYPLLEMSHGSYVVIKEPIYVYSLNTGLNDKYSNLLDLLRDELTIRRMQNHE